MECRSLSRGLCVWWGSSSSSADETHNRCYFEDPEEDPVSIPIRGDSCSQNQLSENNTDSKSPRQATGRDITTAENDGYGPCITNRLPVPCPVFYAWGVGYEGVLAMCLNLAWVVGCYSWSISRSSRTTKSAITITRLPHTLGTRYFNPMPGG